MPTTPQNQTATAAFLPTPDSNQCRPETGRIIEPGGSPTPKARNIRRFTDVGDKTRMPPSDTTPKWTVRKPVDSTYSPGHGLGNIDGQVGATPKGGLDKRKRAPGVAIEVGEQRDVGNGEPSAKRSKGSKGPSDGRDIIHDTDGHLRLDQGPSLLTKTCYPELPVTPTLPPKELTIYPTPSSPNWNVLGRTTEPVVMTPTAPGWNSVSPVEFDNEQVDPSWGSPKLQKKSRGASKINDDELYLPSPRVVNRDSSNRQLLLNGVEDGLSDDDDDEYIDRSLSRNEKKGVVYDFSLEKAKRWAAAVNLPENTWCEAEKELFFRLAMRGFEFLLPRHWQLDFPTLPDTLFSVPDDEREPLVQSFKDSDFHGKLETFFLSKHLWLIFLSSIAIKSLASLFALGGHVRDCSILRSRPELKIKRAIKNYIRWALQDADIYANPEAIPVYTIYAQKKGESIVNAVTHLNRRLGKLCKRYHDAMRVSTSERHSTPPEAQTAGATRIKQEPNTSPNLPHNSYFPLLVGFVICGPIVAVITLDTDPLSPKGWEEETGTKFISQFDVGEQGQDVWTSLAVAITAMNIRGTTCRLVGEGEGGFCRLDRDVVSDIDEDL